MRKKQITLACQAVRIKTVPSVTNSECKHSFLCFQKQKIYRALLMLISPQTTKMAECGSKAK